MCVSDFPGKYGAVTNPQEQVSPRCARQQHDYQKQQRETILSEDIDEQAREEPL